MNLRDLILNAPDLEREAVEVPEWKDADTGKPITVYVAVMSGLEFSKWNKEAYDADGNVISDRARTRLLVHCLVDQQCKPIFTEADIDVLDSKNTSVIYRLFQVALRINGLGKDAEADAEKNS